MNAALVIPQFGDICSCNYLPLWLSTVRRQPFDVLLFTNYDISDTPNNVRVIKTTVNDVFDRAEAVIKGKITCRRPYKLCDLRILYGSMFEDELSKYDYWGWGDCDVMYGEMPEFPAPVPGTPELFCHTHTRPDIALVKSETPVGRWYMPGHFLMMRNDHRSRNIINYLPTAASLIKADGNKYIDEHLAPTALRELYGESVSIKSTDYQYLRGREVVMKDGKLRIGGEPFNYLHFYNAKGRVSTPPWRDIPHSFNLSEYM